MIIALNIRLPDDATLDDNGMRLYDTLQNISPSECHDLCALKVDEEVEFGDGTQLVTAFRPE